MSEFFFKKTLVIGIGLIGGSFAKSLKKHKLSQEIYACDLDEETVIKAQKHGVIEDRVDLESDLSSFDFIVIATPLPTYKNIFAKIKETVSKKTIIIDLGSAKSFIKEILPTELRENFVGCHPIAGLEISGFEASDENLFEGKKLIICSNNKTIENLAKKMGFIPEFLDAKKHDEIYGLVSHLPQFLSFLTKEFLEKDINDEFFKRVFRLDKSSAEAWDGIFKFNEKNLEKFYLEFFDNLVDFIEKLPSGLDFLDPGLRRDDKDTTFLPFVIPAQAGIQPISSSNVINPKFLEENFPAVFFRLLVVLSYLKIKKIPEYKPYAGSGFKDFTLITELLNYDVEKLLDLVKKHQKRIIKIFESIS